MGWNKGYRILEATVITLYDEGILTKGLLIRLMQLFVGTDVDRGEKQGLVAKDGLSADEIVCKVMRPVEFELLPLNTFCSEGKCPSSCKGNGRSCKVSELWHQITSEEW